MESLFNWYMQNRDYSIMKTIELMATGPSRPSNFKEHAAGSMRKGLRWAKFRTWSRQIRINYAAESKTISHELLDEEFKEMEID